MSNDNRRIVPEHIRLGIKSPAVPETSLLHDPASRLPLVRNPNKRLGHQPPPLRPISTQPVAVTAAPPGEPTSYATTFVRGRNAVQIGNHEDSLWTEGLVGKPVQPFENKAIIDNNDYVDLEAAAAAGLGPQQTQQQENKGNIPEGAYGIFYNAELVLISFDADEIRRTIQNWCLEHQVPINELTVFKNVPIDIGVILG